MNETTKQVNELIALGKELVSRGLVQGSGGNLSFRWNDHIFITRSGALLHQLTPEDFLPVSLDSPYQPSDSSSRPSVETPMHRAAYRSRVQAGVVVHCHPIHAIAWAMQEKPLPACTPDFSLYLGRNVPSIPFRLPGSEALSTVVGETLAEHPAALLGNHGVIVTGETVDQARIRILLIDETAHICLLAAAAGQVRPLEEGEFNEIIDTYGS